MKTLTLRLYRFLVQYGFDGKQFVRAILAGRRWVRSDFKKLIVQKGADDTFKIGNSFTIISDKKDHAGIMRGHYFHQDLHIAQLIFEQNPERHIDIGSRTDGFVAHVASFREIELLDIRNIESTSRNIVFRQANLMELPEDLVDACDSISSLHAIEHFGLGRYGDPIDYFGYKKAIENITRILKEGGTFYFSVPIGPQRIEFNAHRVFSLSYLLELLSDSFEIRSFSFVDDQGNLHRDQALTQEGVANSFGCNYGCGIFQLKKK
jgi:hypothetical protein